MLLMIITLVLGIALVVGAFSLGSAALFKENGLGIVAAFVLGLAGLALALGSFGWTEVPAGHVGIVTSFGRIDENTLGPGLHWRVPVVNAVSLMDSRVQVYSFDAVEGASSDLQAVTLTGIVNFHLDPAAAATLYQTVGVDYKEKIFTRPADTSLKSITPRFRADAIVAQRGEIGRLTAEALQTEVSRYGIIVDGVSISNIGLSADFLLAIEEKVRAEQEAAKERQLIEVSKARAQQAIEQARGDAEARIERARGEAEANRQLALSLTPEVISWQNIQKLNPNVQVMYLPTGNQFILPLPSPTTPAAGQ